MVTLGALGAILCAPAPTYYRDGRVGLGSLEKVGETPEGARRRRVRMHFYQKYGLPLSFSLIAIGSALQGLAAYAG